VPGLVLLLFVTLREVGFKFRLDPLRRMISFGAPLILSFTSFFVIHFSDRFFVNAYVSLSALGVYSLAYKYGFLVSYLIGEPFGRAWNVRFYEFLKQPEWRSDFARVARYLFFALVLGGAVLSLFAGPVFKVIAGPAFRQGALFAPVIVGAYVLRECGDFFRNLLYINKRSTVVGYTGLLCAVVNISLNFLLIPRFGMWGAAWATMATWLVYALALGVIAQLEHRLPLSFRRIGALFALAVAAVWAASRCTGYSPVLDLAAPVCMLGALCGGTLLSGYFSREELVFVRNAVCYAMKRLFSARITT
jgi:O-antigen/teichoic acid export membrane protein